jgi:hypothetical protein
MTISNNRHWTTWTFLVIRVLGTPRPLKQTYAVPDASRCPGVFGNTDSSTRITQHA